MAKLIGCYIKILQLQLQLQLPPGSIWSTGQFIGLGYRKTLREAVCPPHRGSTREQVCFSYAMTPIPVPASTLPLHLSPSPDVFVQSGNWGLSGKFGSTLAVFSEVHHHRHTCPSFHPYYLS